MLGRRRRRWANIEPAVGQRLVFTGIEVIILITMLLLSQLD